MEIRIPDIGDFRDVPVIEVHVALGDVVAPEDPIITLESDKAAMDIPALVAGTVTGVRVAVGDRVSAGHLIVDLRTGDAAALAGGGGSGRPLRAPARAGPRACGGRRQRRCGGARPRRWAGRLLGGVPGR